MSLTTTDLDNAKLDVEHIAALATSDEPTAEDRFGNVKTTWAGLQQDLSAEYAETVTGANRNAAEQAAQDAAASLAAALTAGHVFATIAAALASTDPVVATNGVFWVRPNGTDGLVRLTAFVRTGSSTYAESQAIPSGAEVEAARRAAGGTTRLRKTSFYRDAVDAVDADVDATGRASRITLDSGDQRVRTSQEPFARPRHRDAYDVDAAMHSMNDRGLVWFDALGRMNFVPGDDLRGFLDRQGVTWRGTTPTVGPARFYNSDLAVAAVQDNDRFVYEAVQRLDGSLSTFVPKPVTAAIRMIGWIGQSNAGAPVDYPEGTYTFIPYPAHVLTFSGNGIRCGGYSLQPASDLVDFAPAGPDWLTNNFGATLCGQSLEYLIRRRPMGGPSAGILTHTANEGGMPLSYFHDPDGNWWKNAIQARERAVVVAAQYGRTVVESDVVWVQGETPDPPTRSGYSSGVLAFGDDFRPELRDATGQDDLPRFWIVQTNVGDYPDPEPKISQMEAVNLGQWDAARTRLADGYRMPCPMYAFPIMSGDDNIHTILPGRPMFGETVAAAIDWEDRNGTPWKPLQPVSAVRSGTVVTITYDVPAGCTLTLDSDWVKPIANKGFAWTDSTNSATVTGVAVTGPNTIQLTLSNTPTGTSPKVQYAIGLARDAVTDHWASGRGQVMALSTIPSRLPALGYAVPATIRHYSVKFDMEVTS